MTTDPNKKGLTLNDYQREAYKTDQIKETGDSIANSIANLLEEVGSLLRWYQQDKMLDDQQRLEAFLQKAPAKLGDILWYVANIAHRIDRPLSEIAEANLDKVRKRWPSGNAPYHLYDEQSPSNEQIPRKMDFYVKELSSGTVLLGVIGAEDAFFQLGDRIDDNAEIQDGYRFHDVLHIAYAAYLGWSPVLRAMLKRKRKSNPEVDVVQDGARAKDLEEALTAFIFEHAKTIEFFERTSTVDFKLIKQVERLTMTREVSSRSPLQWKEAILEGYRVFRQVKSKKGGVVTMNLKERTLTFSELTRELSLKYFNE